MANTGSYVSPQDTANKGARIGRGETTLAGTLTLSGASTVVTGSGTAFLAAISALLTANPKGGVYLCNAADSPKVWIRIASVADDTHLALIDAYTGTAGSGKTCHIATSLYGSEGGDVESDSEAYLPSYVTLTPTNRTSFHGGSGTAPNDAQRFTEGHLINGLYYSNAPASDLLLDLVITGGLQHQFSIYAWDSTSGRDYTITILDGDDGTTVLAGPISVTGDDTAPVWTSFNIGGHVKVKMHSTGSTYKSYAAIAFDPVVGGATREIKCAGESGGYAGDSGGCAA